MGQTLTIGEAAALLRVHRNTVRNRIKAGHYKAHKVVTPQGETYAIERDSLGLDPDNRPDNAQRAQVHHSPDNRAQAAQGHPVIVDDGQQAQLAIVQSLLAPFIEQLGATKMELGRVTERLAATERERDELAAEVELLRELRLYGTADLEHLPAESRPPDSGKAAATEELRTEFERNSATEELRRDSPQNAPRGPETAPGATQTGDLSPESFAGSSEPQATRRAPWWKRLIYGG